MLSPLHHAPASIRETVEIDGSDPDHAVEHYRLRLSTPDGVWMDLDADFDSHGVHVKGAIGYDDSGTSVPIERICVDTGSNGFFSMSTEHDLASHLWASQEYGERKSMSLRAEHRSWRAVATSLSVGGVVYRPAPVDLSDRTAQSLVHTPLLGQEWFASAAATWIDPAGGLLAVSFDDQAVDKALSEGTRTRWVSVPWRAFKPNGHRFMPIEIGGDRYEAIIDTGMGRELFIEVSRPPGFVPKPWKRFRVIAKAGPVGPMRAGVSDEPVHLGGIQFPNPFVMWLDVRRNTLPRLDGGQPVALLGLDFLRRAPVLLDPRNDRAHFYLGDRDDLPPSLDPSLVSPTKSPS